MAQNLQNYPKETEIGETGYRRTSTIYLHRQNPQKDIKFLQGYTSYILGDFFKSRSLLLLPKINLINTLSPVKATFLLEVHNSES